MEIKDVLKSNLEGETLTDALSFTDYLIEKGLTPMKEWSMGFRFVKNEKSPCLLVLTGNKDWFLCDFPVVNEAEWGLIGDDLKEFILANVKTCSVYQGNACGCGSEPGVSKHIFGKNYDNVCTSEIQFNNPCSNVLDKLREVIDWWVINIGA